MWKSPPARNRHRSKAPRRASLPLLEPLETRAVMSASFDSVLTIGNDVAAVNSLDSAVDSAGNTYVTGTIKGTIDFDPAAVHADGSDVLTALGTTDAYVAKYNADGSFAWARALGSDYVQQSTLNTPETGNGVRVDASGNVYVAGTFFGKATFGTIRLTSAGDADAFVAKLSPIGTVLWAKSWGGTGQDMGNDVAVDSSGNVIAVGATAYSDPVSGWIANTSQIRKYSSAGASTWSASIAGPTGAAYGVGTDAAGNVYTAGRFSGTVDFNPSATKTNSVTANYGSGYVLKLTSAGAYGWVSTFQTRTTTKSSGSAMTISDMDVDAAGNVAVSATFQGTIDFNPSTTVESQSTAVGTIDGAVVKLASNGSLVWARDTGGSNAVAVALDAAGAVYVGGTFSTAYGVPDFNPGFGLPSVPGSTSSFGYLTKYNASGTALWAVTIGGIGTSGISVDASGEITLAGGFAAGTVDFDPDPMTSHTVTNEALTDVFILKLKQV